jgi:hypothetical protein
MPAAAVIPASTWKAAENPSLSALAGMGSEDPARDGRAMAVMLGLLLDRLTHPPQDQDVVVAAVRWLPLGLPGGGAQPGPRNR